MITRACVEMKEPSAQQWYLEERSELKKLPTWDAFAQHVKTRFLPSNWKLDALRQFYDTRQAGRDFKEYAAELQGAKNQLPGVSSRSYYAISDATFKNHLLFFAHPQLILRVLSQPTFALDTIKTDSLIALMTTAWESLLAEGLIRSSRAGATGISQLARPYAGLSTSAMPPAPLSIPERTALREAGGCFNCRRTPSSVGWVPHSARNCPGDPARNIPPGPNAPNARVPESGSIKKEPVAALYDESLPSCVLEDEANDDFDSINVAAVLPYAKLKLSDCNDSDLFKY
ncbi:hypothetical protein SCHPADRAFT_947756 [Schizopora paradoxa]|uniref:Uncharacterized protein n=1 Tax=Schizopora paradoxa TaxID=27342 RepID=A0A0H2QXL8_9AGAM|nr:hypothetical protein SCHPADRAFT_947756 [Schizopora paradoxa]